METPQQLLLSRDFQRPRTSRDVGVPAYLGPRAPATKASAETVYSHEHLAHHFLAPTSHCPDEERRDVVHEATTDGCLLGVVEVLASLLVPLQHAVALVYLRRGSSPDCGPPLEPQTRNWHRETWPALATSTVCEARRLQARVYPPSRLIRQKWEAWVSGPPLPARIAILMPSRRHHHANQLGSLLCPTFCSLALPALRRRHNPRHPTRRGLHSLQQAFSAACPAAVGVSPWRRHVYPVAAATMSCRPAQRVSRRPEFCTSAPSPARHARSTYP